MFRDYVDTFQEIRTNIIESYGKGGFSVVKSSTGIDCRDFESVYRAEMKALEGTGNYFSSVRMLAELMWYRQQRPYFNVFPSIERKLYELDTKVELASLRLPFKTIEVRTSQRTVLLSDMEQFFLMVVEFSGGDYREVTFPKRLTLKEAKSPAHTEIKGNWHTKAKGKCELSTEEQSRLIYLAAGVCLLANDPTIVVPVVLNRDANVNVNSIGNAAARAIAATGRVGFNVGKEFESTSPSMHYRNGCLAIYHVGRGHAAYPKNGVLDRETVILWRSGAVVNKDKLPTVPTGFKGVDSDLG